MTAGKTVIIKIFLFNISYLLQFIKYKLPRGKPRSLSTPPDESGEVFCPFWKILRSHPRRKQRGFPRRNKKGNTIFFLNLPANKEKNMKNLRYYLSHNGLNIYLHYVVWQARKPLTNSFAVMDVSVLYLSPLVSKWLKTQPNGCAAMAFVFVHFTFRVTGNRKINYNGIQFCTCHL